MAPDEVMYMKRPCGVCHVAGVEYCRACAAFRCAVCEASGMAAFDEGLSDSFIVCEECGKRGADLWCFYCYEYLCTECSVAKHDPDLPDHYHVCKCQRR